MERVSSGSPFEPTIGFSRAVRAGDQIMVSGTAPIWPDGDVDPDAAAQMRRCLEIVTEALASLGASTADVVRTRSYLVDPRDWPAIGRVHGEVFGDIRPASTMVVVAALLDPRWKVEVEADAIIGSGGRTPHRVGDRTMPSNDIMRSRPAVPAATYRRPGIRTLLWTWIVAVPIGVIVRSVWVGSPNGGHVLVFVGVALVFTLLSLLAGRGVVGLLERRRGRADALPSAPGT